MLSHSAVDSSTGSNRGSARERRKEVGESLDNYSYNHVHCVLSETLSINGV